MALFESFPRLVNKSDNKKQKSEKNKCQINIMQEKSFTTASEDKEADYVDLRVMTLNCWGLYGVSSLRNERMHAIAKYLAESDFDIVLLQVGHI